MSQFEVPVVEAAVPQWEARPERVTLVDAQSGRKPKTVALLNDWAYVEHSLMRLVAAWGRYLAEWDDKVAVHRHVWEQSECVQRLRDRLVEFPGTTGNLETPVSRELEALVNTVLLAPSHEDAIDGIYALLMGALTTAYLNYGGTAHPVHDAPTLATLHQILGFKNGMRLWYRDYRRRHPHTMDADYKSSIERELEACGQLLAPLPVVEAASPCGVNTNYRQPARPARPQGSISSLDLYLPIAGDFCTSIEARRLFWCIGYMREMNLAEEMLRWVWAAHYMPWSYQKELARHLWDESRHGDSGYSRLKDFGIALGEVGFNSNPLGPWNESGAVEYAAAMTPEELFEAAFIIGMVAETGHFAVKNEAYQDFKAGGDMESAEMMIFDIIDEGSHVRYCHEWLPELAARAGLDLGDYRGRAAEILRERQEKSDERAARSRNMAPDEDDLAFREYRRLLALMREKLPLSNAETCPPRTNLPM